MMRWTIAAALLALPAAGQAQSYIFAAGMPVSPTFKMSFLQPDTVRNVRPGIKTAVSEEFSVNGSSQRLLEEYDCGGRRIRPLELMYRAPGGSSRTIRQPQPFSTFPQQGFAAAKWRLVCTGQRTEGQSDIRGYLDMQKVAGQEMAKVRAELARRGLKPAPPVKLY